ncbi:MAG: hypothetical protein HJHJAOHD_01355 [Flavobacteriales bacterium]|nr:hypothetical protein [Flavobacteriales bacterium]
MLGNKQPPPPKTKNVKVDGVTYTLKSDHPKELEILIAVKNLKKGEELSKEQALIVFEIVIARTYKVSGTKVSYNDSYSINDVCSGYVEYVYDGLINYNNIYSNPLGTAVPKNEESLTPKTTNPIRGMPIFWDTKISGHVGIFYSMEDLGGGLMRVKYFDQNNGYRRYVDLAEIILYKEDLQIAKVFSYF